MSNHFSYELEKLQSWELAEGIQAAIDGKMLKNFRDLGSKIRDLIHGLPDSFSDGDFSISQIEVYLGCARADQLYNRFSSHRESKGHQFGVVVGVCPNDQVGYMEQTGIRFLKKLEDQGSLCVRNASIQAYRGDSRDEKIVAYMTFRIDRRVGDLWLPPNKLERSEIYKSLLKEVGPLTEKQPQNWRAHIREVVDEVHKKTSKQVLRWHGNHKNAA